MDVRCSHERWSLRQYDGDRREQTTIDLVFTAGDERRAVAGEKGNQFADVFRCANPTKRMKCTPRRDHLFNCLVVLAEEIGGMAEHGGINRSRANGDDANVLVSVIERHGPGERVDRTLARGVGSNALLRGESLD